MENVQRTLSGLVQADAAILIPESRLNAAVLGEQIAAILQHPEGAQRMAAGALEQGRPDATDRLVGMVEDLARKSSQRAGR